MNVPINPSTRPGLSRDRIVDAAIRLAAAEGVNGLSMRRLATELGVQAMSLYHYVPSNAALLVLMADRTVAALPDPDPNRTWEEQLLAMLLAAYRAGVGNPAVCR
ncbi:regulatory protein, tetR family [Nakamurella panacisegetis]|uniref:Regulatory protein, tetR family n=1 Tax=Nakamurella panacisegetis TaxID=1090615 RepID=A0A1H0RGZ9_9ACTN|nr:TetR family transcriptional regulator [Nakamurella panacisegetis]SDP28784.1 regulatory protein, tetR family [Nakamurella panacisegetis]